MNKETPIVDICITKSCNDSFMVYVGHQQSPTATFEKRSDAELFTHAEEMRKTLVEAHDDLRDAHDNHIYNGDEDHPKSKDDCRYCCTLKRIRNALDGLSWD